MVHDPFEHPELRALRNFGVEDDHIGSFQVLCLPENLTAVSHREELINAGGTSDLAKQFKGAGLKCATSYDLMPEAKTVDRRGGDLWLGTVWVLANVALPLVIGIVANVLTHWRQMRIRGQDARASLPQVHLNLRIKQGSDVAEIDYSGDAETLCKMLEGLKPKDKQIE